jgi:hypothetical protein
MARDDLLPSSWRRRCEGPRLGVEFLGTTMDVTMEFCSTERGDEHGDGKVSQFDLEGYAYQRQRPENGR